MEGKGEVFLILLFQAAAYLVMIAVNALANSLPLNGQTTGEISNKLEVLFTPAGYVFSIWGFIYLLLAVWVARQYLKKRRDLPINRLTGRLFFLTCILNSLWVFAWHYEYFLLSVIIMIALLLTLIIIYKNVRDSDPDFLDIVPFSVYLGWISVAAIANISFYLTYTGWDGWGLTDIVWTYIMLAVATTLALVFRVKNDDWVYPLVFMWAFAGIAIRNMDNAPNVAFAAAFAAIFTPASILLTRKKT